MRPEYLSEPTFRNRREFAYALLENEYVFGYTVRDIDGTVVVASRYGPAMSFSPSSSTTGKGYARSSMIRRLLTRNTRTGSVPGKTTRE